MYNIIAQLKTQLAEYESGCGASPSESILEFLWYCYSASSPIDDGQIKKAEAQLDPIFGELSFHNSNILFDTISDLCLAYQRAAFFEGLQTGFRLADELEQLKNQGS